LYLRGIIADHIRVCPSDSCCCEAVFKDNREEDKHNIEIKKSNSLSFKASSEIKLMVKEEEMSKIRANYFGFIYEIIKLYEANHPKTARFVILKSEFCFAMLKKKMLSIYEIMCTKKLKISFTEEFTIHFIKANIEKAFITVLFEAVIFKAYQIPH